MQVKRLHLSVRRISSTYFGTVGNISKIAKL